MKMEYKDRHDQYKKGSLSKNDLLKDPFKQFETWFTYALDNISVDANAMVLSTVNEESYPSSRVVLLKGFSESGLVFYTNYLSHKAQEMAINPQVALCFFWPSLERQIRICGKVKKISEAESDAYFLSRPRGSQLAAVASKQSQEVQSRQELLDRLEDLSHNEPLKRPDYWGGYCVEPEYFEFWQGRENRLHDRFVYSRQNSLWHCKRLEP